MPKFFFPRMFLQSKIFKKGTNFIIQLEVGEWHALNGARQASKKPTQLYSQEGLASFADGFLDRSYLVE